MGIEKIFRKLPEFKGKKRLARLLMKNKISTLKDVTVHGKYGSFLLPNVKEIIGFEMFVNGEYEPYIIDLLCDKLPDNGVMLDIGANIGTISIPIAKRKPSSQIIGVEASPKVFSYLEKNKQLNNVSNCTYINKGVSDKSGELLKFYSPDVMFGKGSQTNAYAAKSDEVLSTTIDELASMVVSGIDVIKIDIEGYEYYAFKGGIQTLSKPDAPIILFEFLEWAEQKAGVKPGNAQQLLMDLGYTLYEVIHSKLTNIKAPITKGYAIIIAEKL